MKTFPRGGVHPSDNKLSRAEAVEVLALPDVVNVPLSQHIGAPAVAKVAKGDKVKVGELIAEAAGFVSANIHAPVSGTVTGVDMLPNGQGIRQMMITIRREGMNGPKGSTLRRSSCANVRFRLRRFLPGSRRRVSSVWAVRRSPRRSN